MQHSDGRALQGVGIAGALTGKTTSGRLSAFGQCHEQTLSPDQQARGDADGRVRVLGWFGGANHKHVRTAYKIKPLWPERGSLAQVSESEPEVPVARGVMVLQHTDRL